MFIGMAVLKSVGTKCSICSDDGMRNTQQHEDKSRGWACNNSNMEVHLDSYDDINKAGAGFFTY